MRDRLRRRVAQLLAGLVLYGASDSLLVLAHLGIDPWDVFQQGRALHTGLTIGTWAILGRGVVFVDPAKTAARSRHAPECPRDRQRDELNPCPCRAADGSGSRTA